MPKRRAERPIEGRLIAAPLAVVCVTEKLQGFRPAAAQVLAQPLHGFDVGVLDHVGGIHPGLELVIQAHLHHAA
jgi:hypothetical protein